MQIDDVASETAGLGGEVLVSKAMERAVFDNQSLDIKFCLLIPVLCFGRSNLQTAGKDLALPRKYARKIKWLFLYLKISSVLRCAVVLV